MIDSLVIKKGRSKLTLPFLMKKFPSLDLSQCEEGHYCDILKIPWNNQWFPVQFFRSH
jgi:hypothetical protein